MNLYVGNLSYDVTEEALRAAFQAHGEVQSCALIMDKLTGRPRGFGFVEMPDRTQAEAAMSALNNRELSGRAIAVSEARPKGAGGASGGDRPRGRSSSGGRW